MTRKKYQIPPPGPSNPHPRSLVPPPPYLAIGLFIVTACVVLLAGMV